MILCSNPYVENTNIEMMQRKILTTLVFMKLISFLFLNNVFYIQIDFAQRLMRIQIGLSHNPLSYIANM